MLKYFCIFFCLNLSLAAPKKHLNTSLNNLVMDMVQNFPATNEIPLIKAKSLMFQIYTDQTEEMIESLDRKAENGTHFTDDETWWHFSYIVIADYLEKQDKIMFNRNDLEDLTNNNQIPKMIHHFYNVSHGIVDDNEL